MLSIVDSVLTLSKTGPGLTLLKLEGVSMRKLIYLFLFLILI